VRCKYRRSSILRIKWEREASDKQVTHIGEHEITAYWKGSLSAQELVRLDEHIESCERCRALLFDAAPSCLLSGDPHVEYAALESWVNQTASAEERRNIEAHLEACASCREEAEDLRRLRGQMQQRRPWIKPAAIAAAILLAALAIWRFGKEPAPSLTIALRDNGRTVGLDSAGSLAGLESSDSDAAARIAGLLRGGKWDVQFPAGLTAPATSFLGPDGAATAFPLTTPLGKVVLDDRPVFSWNPLQGATYRVHVTDEQFQPVAESESLTLPTWQPAQRLPRGRLLLWQVAATRGSETTRAPQPPQPEARFYIATAEVGARIAAAQARTPVSRLELAMLYAEAGMRAECERELQLLAGENKGSPLIGRWLDEISNAKQ